MMAAETRTISVRVERELSSVVMAAAALCGQTVSEFARDALLAKVEVVRADPKLQDRARVQADAWAAELEERIATLRRLGGGD